MPSVLIIPDADIYFYTFVCLFVFLRHQSRLPMCGPHPIHPKTKDKVNFPIRKKNSGQNCNVESVPEHPVFPKIANSRLLIPA